MTDWDKQIAADMEKSIARIEAAIAGKRNDEYVRLPLGDATPLLVGAHRTNLQIKRRELEAFIRDNS